MEEGRELGSLQDILDNSQKQDGKGAFFISPNDLQEFKAFGVTYPISMIERMVEEIGDKMIAQGEKQEVAFEIVRERIFDIIKTKVLSDGGTLEYSQDNWTKMIESLSNLKANSPAALELMDYVVQQGMSDTYLKAGLDEYAEIFNKLAEGLKARSIGQTSGYNPTIVRDRGKGGKIIEKKMNNPEAELTIFVNSRGEIVAAAMGNDANSRSVEGHTPIYLGIAKEVKGSASLSPFMRLVDGKSYTKQDVQNTEITLIVKGKDGFEYQESANANMMNRTLDELVEQLKLGEDGIRIAADGAVLMTGTCLVPGKRNGKDFTHNEEQPDLVVIKGSKLAGTANMVVSARKINYGLEVSKLHLMEANVEYNIAMAVDAAKQDPTVIFQMESYFKARDSSLSSQKLG